MDVPDRAGRGGQVPAGMGVTSSEVLGFTHSEVDQLVGSSLWIGRLHSCLASFLDTVSPDDPGLIEFFNHAPVDLVLEVLPTTTMLVAEVKARADAIIRSIDAALDSAADRVLAEETGEEFDNIIRVEFGKGRRSE